MEVLNEYIQDDLEIVEYTRDGVTISHIVKTPILQGLEEPQPSTEEEILYETKYQTLILEMRMF